MFDRSSYKTLLEQDQGNDRLTSKNAANPNSSHQIDHKLTRKRQAALANRAQLPPIKLRPLHSQPPLQPVQ